MAPSSVSRRQFLRNAAAMPLVFSFAAQPPAGGRKVRHASIGASGMAWSDINAFAKHPAFELVAVADVDLCPMSRVLQMFPNVRVYQDWRELLKKEGRNLDSINVSTPDHMHAPIAITAMRMGKHVYVQKPLAATIRETRVLTEYARRQRVVTQMGIQTSSSLPQRQGEALVRSGIAGKITEVHSFSNKSWGEDGLLPEKTDPVPPTLDWARWLGVSDARPYQHGKYHPGEWRRRVGFGTGTLGDMGCHIFSPPYRALGLTAPIAVTSHGPSPTRDSWAVRARFHYVFPGTPLTAGDTVDVWWYDGSERPPGAVLERAGGKVPPQGSIFIGTEGTIVLPHGPAAFMLPAEKFAPYKEPEIAPRDHYAEFLDAVLAGAATPTSAGFDYAGPLTEAVLLGNVAAYFPGETMKYDSRGLRFPDRPEATARLRRTYRKGWTVKEL